MPNVTFYTESGDLMVLDHETMTQSRLLVDFDVHSYFQLSDGTVLFQGLGQDGAQLWITDGASGGTRLLEPLGSSGWCSDFARLPGGRAIFTFDGEPWLTDGTSAGTFLLRDIQPPQTGQWGDVDSSNPTEYTVLPNGQILFVAETVDEGRELWITDGTTAGTHLLADLQPDYIGEWDYLINSSGPNQLTDLGNGRVLFYATTVNNGRELWVTDGTTEGTVRITDIGAGSESFYDRSLGGSGELSAIFVLGEGRAVLSGALADGSVQFWATDGTTQGTMLLHDFGVSNFFYWVSPSDASIIMPDGRLLFQADDEGGNVSFWISDATVSGTREFAELDQAFFAAEFSHTGDGRVTIWSLDDGLWVTDGTAEGTTEFFDDGVQSADGYRYIMQEPIMSEDGLGFFVVHRWSGQYEEGGSQYELWSTDFTVSGTDYVADLGSFVPYSQGWGGAEILSADETGLTIRVWVENDYQQIRPELWHSDGTSAGTYQITDTSEVWEGGVDDVFSVDLGGFSPSGWSFTFEDPADLLLFSHFAVDAYNGDAAGGGAGGLIRPPAGWEVLTTTWDGSGALPMTADGAIIADRFRTDSLPTFQATAYRDATGRVVIAYRGTDDPTELFDTSIAMGLGLADQGLTRAVAYLQMAVDFYESVVADGVDPTDIAFAGHSLGGIVAGYLAGITGSQAMILASGPHTEIVQSLDHLIEREGPGFLSGPPNFDGVTHIRVTGEVLGLAVEAAQTGASAALIATLIAEQLAVLTPPQRLVLEAVTEVISAAVDRWGDAQVEAHQLPELDPELGTIAGLWNMMNLHSGQLHQLMLYAEHAAGITGNREAYKSVDGFLLSFFDGALAARAAAVVTDRAVGQGWSTDEAQAAGAMFAQIVLSAQDGGENVLRPLLNHANTLLAAFDDLALGLGPYINQAGQPDARALRDGILDALTHHFVESAARALLSGSLTYEQVLGASTTGGLGAWLRLTPHVFGADSATHGMQDLRDLLFDVAKLSDEQRAALGQTANLFIQIDDSDQTALFGTTGNDLVIGVVSGIGLGADLNGAGGNDVLVGTGEDDTLSGGGGTNLLMGGMGDDLYVASATSGARTIISDLGGRDALQLGGQIQGYDLDTRFLYATQSLVLRVGTSGAQVEIIDHLLLRTQDGVGNIERIIEADGSVWSVPTLTEIAFGIVQHGISQVVDATNALVTAAADRVDRIVGTIEDFEERTVQVLGLGTEDLFRLRNLLLGPGAIALDLIGGSQRQQSNGLAATVDYALTIDSDGDGLADATIRLTGQSQGLGLSVLQTSEGTEIRIVQAPDQQFDQFGSDADDDLVTGTVRRDRLGGLGGNDTLRGLAGDDLLVGGNGDDRLEGGEGDDEMFGGRGNDTYVVTSVGDIVVEYANEGVDIVLASVSYSLTTPVENLTLTGSLAIDGTGNRLNNILTGNQKGNSLAGLEGSDVIRGQGGRDTLDGGAGRDTLTGGRGNDVYLTDGEDIIREGRQGGVDLVRSTADHILGSTLEHLDLLGLAVSGTGNSGANRITGTDLGNLLMGLGGNDTLDGGAGADTLVGGAGSDSYVTDGSDILQERADEGLDLVLSSGTWDLGANFENLTLTGTGSIDGRGNALSNHLLGNAASNRLAGWGGSDTLDGGLGADTLIGGQGDDIYRADSLDTILEGSGGGQDRVETMQDHVLAAQVEDLVLLGADAADGTGNDLANAISGNQARNVLAGNDGADTLSGLGGADSLVGGKGNDRLDGGLGQDTLVGGRGADRFVLSSSPGGANADIFTGFVSGEDQILIVTPAYSGLATGALSRDAFLRNLSGQASDAEDRFIFETDTGRLYFDVDGTGAASRNLIAILGPGTVLAAEDFLIV